MEKLTSKCESCGYSMVFDPDKQMLLCSHCGGAKQIVSEVLQPKREYTSTSQLSKNENAATVLECDSCGAKTNIDEKRASGVCPYCGSSSLHKLEQTLDFVPDAIVPFHISKDKARESYKNWIKTRKFVPNKLKSSAKINKMEGYYFPCWNFDFNVDTTYSGIGVERHTRTVRRRGPNGTMITDHETYYTRHPFSGRREDAFIDEATVASGHINGVEMEKLGRFGINGNLKTYNTAYLLGFLSSEFTIDLHNGLNMAKHSAEREVEQRAKREHHYDSYENFKMDNTYSNIKWQYIYLPVWICNFKYQKKDYRFLVNGFTGHVTGKVPRSGWKIFGLVVGILAAVGLVAFAVYKAKTAGMF